MDLQLGGQVIVNGVVLSLMYILIGLGLGAVFSILRVVSFAHGVIYMFGAYVTWMLVTWVGMHYLIALPLAIVVVFLFGLALERVLWHPILDTPMACLIMSLGLLFVIEGGVAAIFGEKSKSLATQFPGLLDMGGVYLSVERLVMVGISVAIVVAVLLFLQNHKQGQAMRAVTDNPEVAALQGIPVRRIQMIGFGITCALAAAGGGLAASILTISPTMGGAPLFKAFIVVVLGGLGSIPGVIVAGFVMGFIDSFGLTLIGRVASLLGFVIFVLVLLIRPRGIMGYEA
ncbi:High-affinity branched-chain amino acid transport system permease protein LivH [subsurface metagenome]